jgi:tetratricopeptide (TPR) repeat protein
MTPEPSDLEGRLSAVLVACLEAIDAGQAPDRDGLRARFPEFAAQLERFLDDQARVDGGAAPLRAVARAAEGATAPPLSEVTVAEGGAPPRPVPFREAGDYELLGEVGRGGMGVVYRALQKSLSRTVALKVLRQAPLGEAADAQRFRNEAEMVAQLDHPAVVPIYEVGEHQGWLFLSMKLIEGGSLAEHLPRFQRDLRAAAALLALVARAVHHAHQRGILHRDLKPSNILLDGEGRPHVTDFGLARRLEGHPSLTQSGALVGTPSYMAPEQASGDRGAVTTAADVYGLGAVLYALLTGRPPFQAETALDTLLQVRERDPQPPHLLNPRVDRDLETICLKCLHKEPAQRYASARELAEDLERWLNREPIQARRAGLGERLGKWIKRRPALAALVGVAAAAGAALVCGVVWHNGQLREAAEQARHERDAADEERRWARRAVDDMYTGVAEQWLKQQPRLQPVQRHFLEQALRFYQHAAEQDGTVPAMRQGTGTAYYRVAGIEHALGRHQQAQESYRKAITLLQKLQADSPQEALYLYQLSASYHGLGLALEATGGRAEADHAYQEAIALCRRLVAGFGDRPGYRDHLASCQITRAALLEATGEVPEAERAFRETLEMLEKPTPGFPSEPRYRNTRAIALDHLANLLVNSGRPGEADPVYRQALAVQEQLVKGDPAEPEYRSRWACNLRNLAVVLQRTGRPAEAQDSYRQALAVQEKLAADFPAVPDYQFDLAATESSFGALLRGSGRREEARKSYERAIAGLQQLADRFPGVPLYRRHLGVVHGNLGNLLGDMGRPQGREEATRRALKVQQRLVHDFPKAPDYRSDLALTYENLGGAYQGLSRWSEAEAARLEALKLREELARSFPAVPRYQGDLANCCWALAAGLLGSPRQDPGQARRAVELADRAVKLDGQAARHWYTLGVAQYRAGDWGAARQALEKALQLKQGIDGWGWLYLAMAHWQLGHKEEARAGYDRAVRWGEQHKPAHAEFPRLREEAAALLGVRGERDAKGAPPRKE